MMAVAEVESTMRVLILLALVGTALAVPRSQQRIVGGESTTIEKYPYMSNMEFLWFGIWWMQSCGGALITSNHVMSAAHCYEGDSPVAWRVRLGSSLASSGGIVNSVQSLILHEGYSGATLDNDIALVRLATPVTFSESIQSAAIPSSALILPDGTPVKSIGWGALWSGGPSPEQLQHVTVNVINQELCAERYAYLKTQPGYQNWPDITDGMLCAGLLDVGGADACQGDSGGPLAYKYNEDEDDVIIGITSWGFGCAHDFYPGVNARVSSYSDWVVKNAN